MLIPKKASIVPYEAFPTSDGNIILGGGNDRLYTILCHKFGKPEWVSDPRFINNEARVNNRDILVPMISEVTRAKTTQVRVSPFSPSILLLKGHDTGMAGHAGFKRSTLCSG